MPYNRATVEGLPGRAVSRCFWFSRSANFGRSFVNTRVLNLYKSVEKYNEDGPQSPSLIKISGQQVV